MSEPLSTPKADKRAGPDTLLLGGSCFSSAKFGHRESSMSGVNYIGSSLTNCRRGSGAAASRAWSSVAPKPRSPQRQPWMGCRLEDSIQARNLKTYLIPLCTPSMSGGSFGCPPSNWPTMTRPMNAAMTVTLVLPPDWHPSRMTRSSEWQIQQGYLQAPSIELTSCIESA